MCDEAVNDVTVGTAIVVEAHYDIQITNRPQRKHNVLTARCEHKVDSASNNWGYIGEHIVNKQGNYGKSVSQMLRGMCSDELPTFTWCNY